MVHFFFSQPWNVKLSPANKITNHAGEVALDKIFTEEKEEETL